MTFANFRWSATLLLAAALAGGGPALSAEQDMSFDVEVTLSEQAAARLDAAKEGIIVYASYYGDPKPSAAKHVDEIGMIDLSPENEQVELPSSGGLAHVTGATVDKKRFAWLDGPPKVNVNVFTARKSSPDNLLECDLIDGPVAEVRKETITVHCGLIEEQPETSLKP